MKGILLVIPGSRRSDRAIEYAVKTAKKEGATLYALYILDRAVAEEALERFSDVGFIGDKPSTQLSEAIMKESRQRGYEELGKVQIKAMEEGVDFEPLMEEGDFLKIIKKTIEKYSIELIITIKKKTTILRRYFSPSMIDELKEEVACRVEIFDEEEV